MGLMKRAKDTLCARLKHRMLILAKWILRLNILLADNTVQIFHWLSPPRCYQWPTHWCCEQHDPKNRTFAQLLTFIKNRPISGQSCTQRFHKLQTTMILFWDAPVVIFLSMKSLSTNWNLVVWFFMCAMSWANVQRRGYNVNMVSLWVITFCLYNEDKSNTWSSPNQDPNSSLSVASSLSITHPFA